ncbi:Nicotinamide/nicotinic acid mononucleotide adenylyltransferase 1 [Tilletia horrida]|uniref:Nicotinamide/nicotinic acid mononucleotide adenylyltransferase 1 n=1 Tax=Tilletia horrida TaxID=155126 RepID=A0AAN6GMC5_9BASI|nr:Nicotinamide/nicotinic acid mononucleotide adenylyltransferase 1 [Tilletia horrida]KAK0568950.1 Nicotinamide/nicotinic acid mononucleotide adenylyltransferase 1 [Tilletia horrida]
MAGPPTTVSGPATSSSQGPPPAVMPRMTDSQPQPSPKGPPEPSQSQLRFAALSVQSFGLDSPPFTGAAGSEEESGSLSDADEAAFSLDPGVGPRSRHVMQDRGHAQAQAQAQAHEGAAAAAAEGEGEGNAPIPFVGRNPPAPNTDADDTLGGPAMSSYASSSGTHMMQPRSQISGSSEGRPSLEGRGGSASTLPAGHPGIQRRSSRAADKWPRQGLTKDTYHFARHRLPREMRDSSKIPLVIVACGSFSPPTYLHLRIFEMAKDSVVESGKYELLAGYYSPVSDSYKKAGLAKAEHRVRMCELAVEKTSTWLMVDSWEAVQGEYQRTALVLDHFDKMLNGIDPITGARGGILLPNGERKRIKIMLLAGGDLIQSFGEPGVWAAADLHHILGKYGCFIIERTGADVWNFLLSHDLLWKYRTNLKIVKQTIYNDISSSKIRLFVKRGMSIKYLLPNSVINYIEHHKLYRLEEDPNEMVHDGDWEEYARHEDDAV